MGCLCGGKRILNMSKVSKKNVGPFLAFTKDWFKKHQRVLLWLVNTPVVCLWFRWVLRINGNRSSVGKRKILQVAPHFIAWREDETHFTKEFRTHNKFAKRIYFAFRHLWWTLHFWDWLVADRWVPKWSFGFLTLTVRPSPGVTVDGDVAHIDAAGLTWAALIAAAGTTPSAGASTTNNRFTNRSTPSNTWTALRRMFFLFDTSSLTADAVISAAVLSLWGTSEQGFNEPGVDINIYSSSPASNSVLVPADFTTLGTTAFSTAKVLATWSTGAFNDFTLNAAGISNISLTGVSKFGGRNATHDVGGTQPGWSSTATGDGFNCSTSEELGTGQDPVLVITYTIGAADGNFLIMF